jgi:hypothetical protein
MMICDENDSISAKVTKACTTISQPENHLKYKKYENGWNDTAHTFSHMLDKS